MGLLKLYVEHLHKGDVQDRDLRWSDGHRTAQEPGKDQESMALCPVYLCFPV